MTMGVGLTWSRGHRGRFWGRGGRSGADTVVWKEKGRDDGGASVDKPDTHQVVENVPKPRLCSTLLNPSKSNMNLEYIESSSNIMTYFNNLFLII
ncbi:hypothetical protein U1Q18_051715 [Sarracenia purpurea var. burkii]